VTPDPSPEAVKLLEFIYGISGRHTYEAYFPGHEVVDILATDLYRGFSEKDYDRLLALAGDKPIAMGEVGAAPSPEILRKQPRWAWFMSWGDAAGGWRDGGALRALYDEEITLTLEELPWVQLRQPKLHYPVLK
jgi:mannan endo-1,4-beta-mannosidase